MNIKRLYGNEKLAEDYFRVIIPFSDSLDTYVTIRNTISGSNVDIISFYHSHGSLKELDIAGIGDNTKIILELILKKGFEKATEIVREKKCLVYQRNLVEIWKEMPGKIKLDSETEDSNQMLWGDIMKALEEEN
ncbi:MAG: hypothetical protein NTU60_08265 [Candidatus Aminicenantes bacterium]|nr:hypothetical protein [Candidatus Aminicenantes bacterium]